MSPYCHITAMPRSEIDCASAAGSEIANGKVGPISDVNCDDDDDESDDLVLEGNEGHMEGAGEAGHQGEEDDEEDDLVLEGNDGSVAALDATVGESDGDEEFLILESNDGATSMGKQGATSIKNIRLSLAKNS